MSVQRQRPMRRGVVGVIVREGRLLVIQRSQFVRAPLLWCFPGGGVEQGETDEQALVRELQEELALTVQPCQPLWNNVSPWKFDLTWWQATLVDDQLPVPNPQEVAQVEWLTIEELKQLSNVLDSNREFVAAWEAGKFAIEGLASAE